MRDLAHTAVPIRMLLPVASGLAALALVDDPAGGGYRNAQIVMATSALLFGGWVFWHHGGPQITGAGVFSLASAAFVGYSGLWWLDYTNGKLPGTLFAATAIGHFSLVAMYFLFWDREAGAERYPPLDRSRSRSAAAWVTVFGVLMLLASVALARVAPGLATGYTSSGGAGVLLIALGLALRPSGARLGVVRIVILMAAIGLYVHSIFSGYGRLTVVAISMSVAAAVCSRLPRRRMKLLVMAGAPFVVLLLNGIREDVVQRRYGYAVAVSDSKGPGSMQGPLGTFAELLSHRGAFPNGDGSTFFASLAVFVPRAVWPEKPVGFGAELTRMLEPDLVSSGHSMAALSTGEWFFDFGALGIVLMVVCLGLAVRQVDRLLSRRLSAPTLSTRDVLLLALPVALIAGLSDLVWVGTFTYVSRTGFIVAVVALMLLLAPKQIGLDADDGQRERCEGLDDGLLDGDRHIVDDRGVDGGSDWRASDWADRRAVEDELTRAAQRAARTISEAGQVDDPRDVSVGDTRTRRREGLHKRVR